MAVGRDAPRGLFHSTARALGVDFVSYLLGELACPTCGVVARSADPVLVPGLVAAFTLVCCSPGMATTSSSPGVLMFHHMAVGLGTKPCDWRSPRTSAPTTGDTQRLITHVATVSQ